MIRKKKVSLGFLTLTSEQITSENTESYQIISIDQSPKARLLSKLEEPVFAFMAFMKNKAVIQSIFFP